ncbi:hypothetical protein [Myxococcus sp. RHSTA-1-4]|uniref:Kelch repeat-containing protein n=1 Tax=Myxococcus sp. RHSTA-1-4 TaxID=2874601 RepID=UPI001CBFCA64|nr:hypothetical protein [Myxococcus sp. RHSTA-1-4]MBZ4423189.1 hypothetical protein [Myxococcus sp. RHSTA-1-4]
MARLEREVAMPFRTCLSSALLVGVLACCSGQAPGGTRERGTWELLSGGAAPSAGLQQAAAFSGREVLVWGGLGDCTLNGACGDGARFDLEARRWTAMSGAGAPAARYLHTGVWTGRELLVWGGVGCGERPNLPCADGAAYAPDSDTWKALPREGAPSARGWHVAAWTGRWMLVWGGEEPQQPRVLGDGARYDVETGVWTGMSAVGAPSARRYHSAVWTGEELLVWGGTGGAQVDTALGDGAAYSPETDTWRPLRAEGAPRARWAHTAVWTGTELVVWGGLGCGSDGPGAPRYCEDGARYDSKRETWTPLPKAGAPTPRTGHSMVWTGQEVLVWGGASSACANGTSGACADGAAYDPARNQWTALSARGAPAARAGHTAVWTGQAMFLWGGMGASEGEATLLDGALLVP